MKKIFWLLCLSLPVSPLCVAQVPAYVSTDHLEGWWPFTGNADDQSTYNRNGVVTGATLSTDRLGNANAAYLFNGISNKIFVPATGITQVVHTTVSAWVKYTGDAESSRIYDTYFQMGDYPINVQGYGYMYTTGELNVHSSCKGSVLLPGNIANAWHHIVIVQDSLRTLTYKDGVLISTLTSSSPTCYNGSNTLYFGSTPADMQWMTGALDDIGFWTRALSACEISALYNASPNMLITTQPSNQNGLVGGTATFTLTAAAASYQWQSNIGTGGAFIDLPNVGQYSGVNTNTLSIAPLTATNHNQLFRCIVSDEEGLCPTTSNVVVLSVEPTGIGTHPYLAGSSLEQNVPNPAAGTTTISYHIPALKHDAYLKISDAKGKKISTHAIINKGSGRVVINTGNLGKGMYIYALVIDGIQVAQKKMAVL